MSVEAVLLEHSSVPSKELCNSLHSIVENGIGGSPAPVRCTKKVYYSIVKHIDWMLSHFQYDDVCTIFSTLRYIARGSTSPVNGFSRLIYFGLTKKITWCEELCGNPNKGNERGWTKAVDDFLFTLTVLLSFSERVKKSLIPVLPMLLKCIHNERLSGSARIEATRSANSVLEVCSVKQKESLLQENGIRGLLEGTINLIKKAGDFELQVTIIESLFRLTSATDRNALALQWFQGNPLLLSAFNAIREGLFEVDCRKFLNHLNLSCGSLRRVFSLPCKKAFIGSYELFRPRDEGLNAFWVDFNMSTSNLSLYVEDMQHVSGSGRCLEGGQEEEEELSEDGGMWESVIIKKDMVKDWNVLTEDGDHCLSISLMALSHTLLPTVPSSSSNMVFIKFGMESDPRHPLQLVFGSKSDPITENCSQYSTNSQCGKQSIAIVPVHLKASITNQQPKYIKSNKDISPIEVFHGPTATGDVECPNTEAQWVTPTRHAPPPITTPATSTPKHSLPNTATRRIPLEFVSSGDKPRTARAPPPKASQSVSSIVLGGNSRVIQRRRTTPTRKPGGAMARNMQHSLATFNKNGGATAEATATTATGARRDKNTPVRSAENQRNSSRVLSSSSSTNNNLHNSAILHSARKMSLTSKSSGSVEDGVSPHFPPSKAVMTAASKHIAKTQDSNTQSESIGTFVNRPKKKSQMSTPGGNAQPPNPSQSATSTPPLPLQSPPLSPPPPPSPPPAQPSPPPPAPPPATRRTRSFGSQKRDAKPPPSPSSSSSKSHSLVLPSKKAIPNTKSSTTLTTTQPKKKSDCSVPSTAKVHSSPIPLSPQLPSHSPPPPSPMGSASPSPTVPAPPPVIETKRDVRASKRTASARLLSAASKNPKTDNVSGNQNSNSKPLSITISPIQPQSKGAKSKGDFEFLRPDSLSHKQTRQLTKKYERKQLPKKNEGRSTRAQYRSKTVGGAAKPPVLPPNKSIIPFGSPQENGDASYAETVSHYMAPIKFSPSAASRAKCNTSFSSSVESSKSRIALSDIFNTCLNRGGQQRNFNLSGASKPRKRKRIHKPNTSSVYGSSPISDSDPNAMIPDSMPLDVSLYSNVSARSIASTVSSRRKYTRACMPMDISWDQASTKKKVSSAGSSSKQPVTKKVLASARTKKGPNGMSGLHIGNFEITESDFENGALEVQETTLTSRSAKGGQKRNGKKKELAPTEKGTKKCSAKDPVPPKPRSCWMKSSVLPPEGSKERRAIDSIYEPQVSSDDDTKTKKDKGNKAKARSKSKTPKKSESRTKTSDTSKTKDSSTRALLQKPSSTRALLQKPSSTRALLLKPSSTRALLQKPSSTRALLQKPSNTTKLQKRNADRYSKAYEIEFDDDQEDMEKEEPPRKIAALSPPPRKIVALSPHVRGESTSRKHPRRRACYIKSYCDGSISDGYMTDTSDLDDDEGDDDRAVMEPHCNSSMPSETSRLTPTAQRRPMKSLSPLAPQTSNFPPATFHGLPSAQSPPAPSLPSLSPLPLPPPPASLHDTTASSPAASSQGDVSPCLELAPPPTPGDYAHTSATILQGFESVCHQLIARSKSNSLQRVSLARISPAHSGTDESNDLKENGLDDACEVEVDDNESRVTLTQISRDIVNSHKASTSVRKKEVDTKQTSGIDLTTGSPALPSKDSEREIPAALSPTAVVPASVGVGKPTSPGLGTKEFQDCSSMPPSQGSSGGEESSCSEESEEDESTAYDIKAEMNAVMATLKKNLTLARTMREQKKLESGSSIKVPDELKELWLGQTKERSSILKEYEKRISAKMEALEKEASKSLSTDETLNKSLQSHIRALRKSTKIQQLQLEHLRSLHSSLYDQMCSLEESQLEQQSTSTSLLNEEMHDMHQRLMKDSQKKKLVKVKTFLQTMLTRL